MYRVIFSKKYTEIRVYELIRLYKQADKNQIWQDLK
jgi:hypothetical protein